MENDYTEDELDRMVEDILKPAATDSATTRLFTCRKCGNAFWSTKKKPSMCPDCFRESHLENFKKDGQSAKAKPEAEKPPAPPEPEPEQKKQETPHQSDASDFTGGRLSTGQSADSPATPQGEALKERERYLTLGLLRRLLDEVDDRAVITIDGVPVTSFYVEHSYNLEDGVDELFVALG